MRNSMMLRGSLALVAVAAFSFASPASAERSGDGEGVDSNLLWPMPGPSNFPTVQSSDIAGHKNVSFSGVFGWYRKPLGLENAKTGGTEWVVEDAFSADFLWAFGLFDVLQIGLALPLVMEQDGVGAMPFLPNGAKESDYALASSSLRDIRFDLKGRFLGGKAEIPDRRDFGIGLDIGVSVPTGDELNFAGDNTAVLFPTAIVDFHRCKLSAAVNIGARLRFDASDDAEENKPRLADLTVGHQGTFGAGLTGHYLKRRLLLSAEGTGVVELDGFDRLGFEYRGAVGGVPDKARAITIWISGGSSVGTGDLLGTPEARVLIGLTYAPRGDDENAPCCGGE